MHNKAATPVLIAASPGPLCDALFALLSSLPQIDKIHVSPDPERTLKEVSTGPTGLVIVIMEDRNDWTNLPHQIRVAAPDCRIAVLANGESNRLDVDMVLQQGARPESLIAAILSLLDP
jgi:hypothetical protein